MYIRLEIASVLPSRQAFITWGTKLAVERMPATVPRMVGIQPSIALSLFGRGERARRRQVPQHHCGRPGGRAVFAAPASRVETRPGCKILLSGNDPVRKA